MHDWAASPGRAESDAEQVLQPCLQTSRHVGNMHLTRMVPRLPGVITKRWCTTPFLGDGGLEVVIRLQATETFMTRSVRRLVLQAGAAMMFPTALVLQTSVR